MINYLVSENIGIQKIVNKNTLQEIKKIKGYEVGVEIRSISKMFNRVLESTLRIMQIKKKCVKKKHKYKSSIYEYKAEVIAEIYWQQIESSELGGTRYEHR